MWTAAKIQIADDNSYLVRVPFREGHEQKTEQKTLRIKETITIEIIMCQSWFARDVTAAMLEVENKGISLFWELNSIFM